MRAPKEAGIVPEMLVAERFRSWRDERDDRESERDERLRNVSGMEREMTLFCGEHVTPCHEQGLSVLGFQEDRIGDDCV